MPVSRNALIRYKTIDNCLRNRYRKWTIDDLTDACSDALYEFEGIETGVSKRTIQMDLQMMRSEKLGYNAPIVVVEKKYYTYEDAQYSITNIPLTEHDFDVLNQVLELLKQFKGFNYFNDISGIVQRLETRIKFQKNKQNPVIQFETNHDLKGLSFLDEIYQAIIQKNVLELEYKSFRARNSTKILVSPYLLKEYRNRWFVIAKKAEKKEILTFALDRIVQIHIAEEEFYEENTTLDFNTYFDDFIGVTRNGGTPYEIRFKLNSENAPYVITKPIHKSQKIVEQCTDGIIFSIHVIPNPELFKDFLGFGKNIEILHPPKIRNTIKKSLELSLLKYIV